MKNGRDVWTARARRVLVAIAISGALAASVKAADQVFFPSVTNVTNVIVQRINAETVRLDIGAWYLTEHAISIAIANRFHAGVPVRLLGDRGSIFEIDGNTRREFYWLASQGVPIRLRYNPTWFPEINHWKMGIFVGQNVVEFGSANWTAFELAPFSSSNYNDNTTMFTDDPALVAAFKARFDQMWNDTAAEPGSIGGGPPYLKNWNDACALEPVCGDYWTQYPNPAPMIINTARLEPDAPTPPDLIWSQGPAFNNRLITEINNESSLVQFVIYRLTVDNITQALLNKWWSGVPVRLIVEPNEYLNRVWPEFWLTHAYLDKLWAAGIPIKRRIHTGLTHMKTLVTSSYATNASSNYASGWQRDHNHFVPAATKPEAYWAIRNQVEAMWNNTSDFAPFQPQPPDAANLTSPASGSVGVAASTPLVWNRAPFATSYDVYLGTHGNMTWVANVPAQLVNNPPTTYSWTPPPLQGGQTYFWGVISRTFATDVNTAIHAVSSIWSFTTAGAGGGGGTLPAPWASQDVGNVGTAGSASYSNGTFTVRGAGANIWGTSDSFRFVYQPANSNLQMWARVTSMQNTNGSAKAGVMLRESLAPNAAHVVLDVKPGGGIEFMTRSSTGAETTYIAGGTRSLPVFLGMVRSGNTVTGYVSGDGVNWNTVGSTSLNIGSGAVAGIIVSSLNPSVLNTSTFDNVEMRFW
jgi:phosphatidylserine/phosphatidylglycerophosphate/cardiolipin synthase-like enzyme